MSEASQFRTVLRGYEPAEVDAALRELTDQLTRLREGSSRASAEQSAQLSARVHQLEAELAARNSEPDV
ncbi:MAG: DivIVA domain-containing protein, partial [Angustibacter sp.]